NKNNKIQKINANKKPTEKATLDITPLLQLNQADAADLHIARAQVEGSNPAVLLQDSDINNDSGILPRALSNKAFIFFNYIWNNRDDWDPYLGFGISAEVANASTEHHSASFHW